MPSQLQLGDPSGFHTLYDRHHTAVFRAAYGVLRDRVLAEDVAQEVFLSLWKRPDRFDAARGEIGSFLTLMARSRAVDAWRTSRCGLRAQERLVERACGEREAEEDIATVVEQRALRAQLAEAVGRLPDSQRQAVALAYWGEMPASEVASRTDVPLGTAKSRLRLGLERLREDLLPALGQPGRA